MLVNNRSLRAERAISLSSGIRSGTIIIIIIIDRYLRGSARKYIYVFWCFIKRVSDALEFLQRPIFLSPFFSLFLFPFLFFSPHSPHKQASKQAACCYNLSRAHSSICLSIIFTGEGILVGAQLRYIDRRQVHRHRFRRQEGHRLRDRIRMRRILRRVRGY